MPDPKRLLMAEQWDQFARSVFPPDVSTAQKVEMRRAFYAGAQAILINVLQSLAPDAEPTDTDLQMMESVYQELRDFGKAIQEGRA